MEDSVLGGEVCSGEKRVLQRTQASLGEMGRKWVRWEAVTASVARHNAFGEGRRR